MPEVITATLNDAERLFTEKVTRLRSEVGSAEREKQAAMETKDQTLHEVSTLQREKGALIESIASLKGEVQRIKDGLAEHRQNVEASLAKQEAKANETINQAAEVSATLKAKAQAIRQLRSQLDGVKQTLLAELQTLEQAFASLLKTSTEALRAIPDQAKSA